MRDYIRHPSDIPIEFEATESSNIGSDKINNISRGGLSFNSPNHIEKDTLLRLNFPLTRSHTGILARVKWCKKSGQNYEVGVQFYDLEDVFRVRMVEQVCHIEHYKRQVKEEEGREISGKEAAMEWIEKYASDFP